jgi:hypothetical protein
MIPSVSPCFPFLVWWPLGPNWWTLVSSPPPPVMASAVRDFPRPCKELEWVRLCLLFIPVSLDLVTKHHSALLGNAGELLAIGHSGAAAITLPSSGSPFSSLLHLIWAAHCEINSSESSIPHSGSILLKRPLVSFYFHPQSLIQKDNSDFDLF